MSTQETHWYWFQGYPVQSSTRRITAPELLVTNKILKVDRPVFWGYENDTRYVVITRDPDFLADSPDYSHRGDSKLFENRTMQVPAQFFDDYEGAAAGSTPVAEDLQFEEGQYRVFATTDALYKKDACYILIDKQARSNLSHEVAMTDGGRLETIFGTDTLRDQPNISAAYLYSQSGPSPEAFEPWEILDLTTGEVLVDTAVKEWYELIDFVTSDHNEVDGSDEIAEDATRYERDYPEGLEQVRASPERYAGVTIPAEMSPGHESAYICFYEMTVGVLQKRPFSGALWWAWQRRKGRRE